MLRETNRALDLKRNRSHQWMPILLAQHIAVAQCSSAIGLCAGVSYSLNQRRKCEHFLR
jgi:hypothetical protein